MKAILQQRWQAIGGWRSPFTAPVPSDIREPLVRLQAERLRAFLPLLTLLIAANAVAMAVAVNGDLPWWQQAAPPLLIVGGCLFILARSRRKAENRTDDDFGMLHRTTGVAAVMGLIAGFWCVNAFEEMEKYYCMTAPVFIGIAALVSATCLLSVPRAAIAAMTATVAPIIVKMAMFDNLGIRAMAAMMVLVTAMQASVVLGKFRETVTILETQHALDRIAKTDSLTDIDNRLSLMEKLATGLAATAGVTLVLIDLDGFKQANDRYGHAAGDAILRRVGQRLTDAAPDALSVARLGGDEFALLYASDVRVTTNIEAIREIISLPFVHDQIRLGVGASIGMAASCEHAGDAAALFLHADERLYADKRLRHANAASALEAA